MITFEKNSDKKLPYDKKQYLLYFDEDPLAEIEWYGFSMQTRTLQGYRFERKLEKEEFSKIIDVLEEAFKSSIAKYDKNSNWIINHEYKDFDWFKNDNDNLPSLRKLFKQNGIPNSFRGSLICSKKDLFAYSRDLISYPFVLSYRNLDISHNTLPLIIKITGHIDINILSTNKALLKEFLPNNSLMGICTKLFRGSDDLMK
jgi:hypothetical protein